MTWKWSVLCLLFVASCAGAPPAEAVIPPHADPAILAQERAAEEAEEQRELQRIFPGHSLPFRIIHVPDFQGEVALVKGRTVILRITANPERRAVRQGYSFMLYDDQKYLGEAVVQEVLPDYTVRCRLELVKGQVVPGDLARTNIPE